MRDLLPSLWRPLSLMVRQGRSGRRSMPATTRRTLTVEALEDRLCLSFEPALGSPFPAGVTANSVALGDFNGDGKPDLATANQDSDDVSILLSNGAGGFAPAGGSPFAVGAVPAFVTVGDFNGDGKPDLAVANFADDNVSILLGDGTGGFAPAANSPFPVGDQPVSVAVGDFNGDRKPDLATANEESDDVSVLLGDGAGGFAPAAGSPIPVGDIPESLAVGDFNGDGKPDLAVANFDDDNVSVLLGNGAGSFAPAVNVGSGDGPASVAVGDFNGDGNLDLATANNEKDDVSVLLGDGTGGFTPSAGSPFPVGDNPISLAAGDFNGDGKLDLAAANAFSNDVSVFLGNGAGGFAPADGSPFPVGAVPLSLAVGDFNGDGLPDLTTANAGSDDVSVLLNTEIAITINDVAVVEGSEGTTNVVFTVSLSRPSDAPLTLDFVAVNGSATAAVDFQNTFGPLTFAPGQTARTVVVPVVGDDRPELDETFVVQVSNPSSGVVVDGVGQATILNDDLNDIAITVGDAAVVEGNAGATNLVCTVHLSRASDVPLTLDFVTLNGSAVAGVDFKNTFGSLTFAPGQTERLIVVPVFGDRKAERDEHFFVLVSNPSGGAVVVDGHGQGMIRTDDRGQKSLKRLASQSRKRKVGAKALRRRARRSL